MIRSATSQRQVGDDFKDFLLVYAWNPLHNTHVSRNLIDGEVANVLRSCYGEIDVGRWTSVFMQVLSKREIG